MSTSSAASRLGPSSGVSAPYETQFKKALLYSAGFHLLLFIIFAVRAVIYPSEAINLEDAVRVDIVALPDKKSAEIPNLPPPVAPAPSKSEPKEQPAPKVEAPKPEAAKAPPKPEAPTVDLNRTKRDQAAALKRLEALERIERMERQQKAAQQPATKSRAAERGEAAPSQIVKGNQTSQGNALKGLQRLEHRGYLANVQQQVKRYWALPNWMVNQKYSARVRIWVDSGGNIIKKQMIRASGNPEFDERVMAAIESAGKLPEPPVDLVNVLTVDGLDADFP